MGTIDVYGKRMNMIRPRWPLWGALLLLVALAGCDIDWLDVFGHSRDGSDRTANVEDTDVVGLDVAASDYRFGPTYDNLDRIMRNLMDKVTG